MIKKFLIASALLVSSITVASAADVTLCSGRAMGGYDGIIQGVSTELRKKGHDVEVINLGGSEDILNALSDGRCIFGPAQKDIHYLMGKKDTSLSSKVAPSTPIYNEVMQMICSAESGYDELSDLRAGDEIIVDVFGSGSSMTWENIVAVEKEFGNSSDWINAVPVYTPLDESAAALGVGAAKCVFGVNKLPASWMNDAIDQGHTVSWIYDKDINDLQFNGSSLYPSVRISSGAYGSKFDTYKVPAFLFRSTTVKIDQAIEKDIKRIVPALGAKVNTVK